MTYARTTRAVEIDRLMAELHGLVSRSERSGRAAIEEALPAAAKLQVVTANVDACNPSRRPGSRPSWSPSPTSG